MKIELKNIKHFASMSEETHCYTASLYVDGKFVCEVRNQGHGGCDERYNTPRSPRTWVETLEKVDAYLGAQKIETPYGEMDNSLEIVCCDLVNDFLHMKDIKRITKTIAFVKPENKKGQYQHMKLAPTDENIAKVKAQSWWKPEWKILNEMPIEQIKFYI